MPISRRRRRRSSPRGRAAEMVITQPRRRPNYWYIAASGVIAFLVIAGFAVGGISFQGNDSVGSSPVYVEGVGVQQEIMPTPIHVSEDENVAYNTTPPTSGNHWDWWARCGFYEDGLPDERIVHNLEHGNIVVSYNLQAGDELDKLREFSDNLDLAPAWGVFRYYDKIDEGTVALSAWGVLDTMQSVDEDRIEEFFQTYAGTLGPEFPNGAPCTSSGVME